MHLRFRGLRLILRVRYARPKNTLRMRPLPGLRTAVVRQQLKLLCEPLAVEDMLNHSIITKTKGKSFPRSSRASLHVRVSLV